MDSFIGFIAAFCTTVSFIPQAVKIHRTKHAKDISLGMFSLMTVGVLIWMIYGIMISSLPMISANLVTLLLSIYILIMKIKLG